MIIEISKQEREKVRKEFCSAGFRNKLDAAFPVKQCVNCGSTNGVEFHHIVPIHVGGTNRISNIAPLCYQCHKSVHADRLVRKEKLQNSNCGRPRKIPDNWEEIVEDFLYCRIGKAEAVNRLGLPVSNHITDNIWFKEYKMQKGIKKYRNNIDIINSDGNKGMSDGRTIGYITFLDRKTITFIYNPKDPSSLFEEIQMPKQFAA